MSNFYARICPNGHVDINFRRASNDPTCPTCGETVIDSCPACNTLIKQWHYYGMVYITPKNLKFERPNSCPKCGYKFYWADMADENE